MNDMKCPFCQQELNQDNPQSIECKNDDCKKSYFMYGSKELWQELIRTRKTLDLALDALKSAQRYICSDKKSYQIIQTAVEQITALEQKGDKR